MSEPEKFTHLCAKHYIITNFYASGNALVEPLSRKNTTIMGIYNN